VMLEATHKFHREAKKVPIVSERAQEKA
jgi:hypothetical protein